MLERADVEDKQEALDVVYITALQFYSGRVDIVELSRVERRARELDSSLAEVREQTNLAYKHFSIVGAV